MNRRRLLARLMSGAYNVSFDDFENLIRGFGFMLRRSSGSHRIYVRPGIADRVNVQARRGEAKPYQVRQFLDLIEKHQLRLEEDE